MPLVSVIMPVYNTAQYLDEAVQSILGQTLRDFEFIVIDDGSTDGSGEILDGYSDERMKVIHQANSGIVASLNKGLELAQGKYVARMDSDDISLPERLARQVAFMEKRPEVGICGTACRLFGDHEGVTKPRTESEEIKSWLLFGPCMAHPTVMMRREVLADHDLAYNPEFKQAEDYELWLSFSEHCEMANLPVPLLMYRIRKEQATSKFQPEIHRWTNLVHAQAIRMLGIEPTGEDLDLHLSIHSAHFEQSRDYVERVENWLVALLEANRKAGLRDEKALATVLFEVWRCVFAREVELGLWMWSKFVGSELAAGQPTMSSAFFLLRSSISGALDKTPAGRSFKQFVKG